VRAVLAGIAGKSHIAYSSVIKVALQLGRKSAYDAVYLVLAERLGAELWTLDTPLYRNAAGHGYPVHLIGESEKR